MFNIAVINTRDLFKYLVGLCLTIIVAIGTTKISIIAKEKKDNINIEIINKISRIKNCHTECLKYVIPGMENTNNKDFIKESKTNITQEKIMKSMLEVELDKFDVNNEKKSQNEITENTYIDNNEEIKEEKNDVITEVVTQDPIDVIPTDTYGNVQIRNQTGYILSEEMLKPDIDIDKTNIVIFHTHTCESYTSTEQNNYEPTGTYRTTDLNFSVARVGDELENNLKNLNYNVIHDKTYHDFPAYSGSYNRSLETVNGILKTIPCDIVVDLHRDAIGSNSNYAPTVKIGDDYAAQLMFVIGTDAGGLWHPSWNQNLKFAIKVQQKSEELYPGLFKPIILRNSRYNQHVSKAATIIEVGATGNTLEESMTSMKYLAKVIDESLK